MIACPPPRLAAFFPLASPSSFCSSVTFSSIEPIRKNGAPIPPMIAQWIIVSETSLGCGPASDIGSLSTPEYMLMSVYTAMQMPSSITPPPASTRMSPMNVFTVLRIYEPSAQAERWAY